MREASYKATKGLIRVRLDTQEGVIKDLEISGDFFMYPEDMLWELEKFLVGKRIEKSTLVDVISGFYSRFGIRSPGITPEDFATVILLASNTCPA